jgi:hypothetical protein
LFIYFTSRGFRIKLNNVSIPHISKSSSLTASDSRGRKRAAL